MSYIKYGVCEKCGNEFYSSVGHPQEWNKWVDELKDMPLSQQWWLSFGNLCPFCEPFFDPVEDYGRDYAGDYDGDYSNGYGEDYATYTPS